jgi:uncharacterized coiled-coil protein SlyX
MGFQKTEAEIKVKMQAAAIKAYSKEVDKLKQELANLRNKLANMVGK